MLPDRGDLNHLGVAQWNSPNSQSDIGYRHRICGSSTTNCPRHQHCECATDKGGYARRCRVHRHIECIWNKVDRDKYREVAPDRGRKGIVTAA